MHRLEAHAAVARHAPSRATAFARSVAATARTAAVVQDAARSPRPLGYRAATHPIVPRGASIDTASGPVRAEARWLRRQGVASVGGSVGGVIGAGCAPSGGSYHLPVHGLHTIINVG